MTAGPFRIPPGTSVEVIHECPTVGGSLANLAKTGKVTQDPAYYSTATNTSPTVPLMKPASGATVYQIFIVNNARSPTSGGNDQACRTPRPGLRPAS